MIEFVSTSLDQTVDLGRRLGQLGTPGDVIALDGELGAGKTQLVRGLAIGLGLDPAHVSSPTFVIMHEYENSAPGNVETTSRVDAEAPGGNVMNSGRILVHIDAYRITGPDDLVTIGFDDELRAEAVTAVEWAARIADLPGAGTEALGEHRLHILIEHRGDQSRRLTLTPHGRWRDRLSTLSTLPNATTP